MADEQTVLGLDVTGTVPEQLSGRYVRNGPNPIDPDPATQHWFTGAGMVHGVPLEEGQARWYRNRYVRSANVTEALGEPAIPAARLAEGVSGSVNTNVIHLAGRTLALVEAGSSPVELSYELDSLASVDLDGTLPGAVTFDLEAAMSGVAGVLPYYWNAARPARVGVLALEGDADDVRWRSLPTGYVFHAFNAFDLDDGRIELDVVRWPRAGGPVARVHLPARVPDGFHGNWLPDV